MFNRRPLLAVPPLVLFSLVQTSIALAADGESSGTARLVNLDGPAVTAKGLWSASFDHRSLNKPEGLSYSSVSFAYGFTKSLELGVRGTTGGTADFQADNSAIIRHGGHDAEVYGKYALGSFSKVNLAALAGASFAGTPAQSQTYGTVSGVGEVKLHDRVNLYVNPKAIFIKSNTICGIGVGTSVRVSDRIHLVGDWTKIISGDNTRSVADGSRIRKDVWGAAVRFSSGGGEGLPVEFDLGWGNASGTTTGMSLTPGLGNSGGFLLRCARGTD